MKKDFLIVNMFLVAGAYLFTGSLLIAMVAGMARSGSRPWWYCAPGRINAMSNHKTADKWRNLIDGYRLHYDLIRLSLIDVAADCGAKSPGEAVSFWKTATRAVVTKSKMLVNMLRPSESLIDGYCRVLRENLGKPVAFEPGKIETMPVATPITAPRNVDYDRVFEAAGPDRCGTFICQARGQCCDGRRH